MTQHSMVSQSLHLLIDPAHTVSVTEVDQVKLQSMLSLPRIFLWITLHTPSTAKRKDLPNQCSTFDLTLYYILYHFNTVPDGFFVIN